MEASPFSTCLCGERRPTDQVEHTHTPDAKTHTRTHARKHASLQITIRIPSSVEIQCKFEVKCKRSESTLKPTKVTKCGCAAL